MDAFEAGFRQQVEAVRVDAQPLAAQLDLPGALLAGDIEHLAAGVRQLVGHTEQQGGLFNSRVAAD
jgi:hypothetical protein